MSVMSIAIPKSSSFPRQPIISVPSTVDRTDRRGPAVGKTGERVANKFIHCVCHLFMLYVCEASTIPADNLVGTLNRVMLGVAATRPEGDFEQYIMLQAIGSRSSVVFEFHALYSD